MLYTKKISRNFVFNLKALFKQFLNNPWVQFDDDYGYYQNINGVDLFFIDSPIDNFSLTNSQFEKDQNLGSKKKSYILKYYLTLLLFVPTQNGLTYFLP